MIAAGLVRMHFHDYFIRGCDASVLLDSTSTNTAEKDSPANKPSLRGYEVNDNAKAKLEALKFANGYDMYFVHAGAHTIGRSHCWAFSSRLYNFSSTSSQDPSLDPSYAALLKRQCPQGSTNPNLVIPMNPSSPGIADVAYYVDILANRGPFTSDQTLLTDAETASQVKQNARDPYLWASQFADAMIKMGQISVITGNAGEIRTNCRVVNGEGLEYLHQ
ncbi:Peroxidase 5 [Glycine soja]|nr:Peroxidase 5 [Glycine soja]